MLCVYGNCSKECDGCGECQEQQPVMYDEYNEPIYEGDPYWVLGGLIYSEKTLNEFRELA